MDIQTFTVEFLRAGPRHNQLLSPITQYLGVCENSPASRVSFPYEHGELERRLQELRYAVSTTEDRRRGRKVLEQTGREIANVLSSIEGVPGRLEPTVPGQNTLTHLRIVLSASELAMLPFEATKVPTGTGAGTLWLALQSRAPVCITRHIRSTSGGTVAWPSSPRILFIGGPDTPVREHRQAIESALAPWRDRKGSVAHLLETLEQTTPSRIAKTLSDAAKKGTPFTHVHILAHGTQVDDADPYSPLGLQFSDTEEPVSGEQLVAALTSFGGKEKVRIPTVVTLASCDSGRQVDVRTSDAAIAHALHDAGIPLVVASQFPLTEEGSIPFVSIFYERQLRGEHPLETLYEVRMELRRMADDVHDWASIVVYESLPDDLKLQLENLRYWQARRAHDGAVKRLEEIAASVRTDRDVHADWKTALKAADGRIAELPTSGPYALECAGLRGSAHKRVAIAAMEYADRLKNATRINDLMAECQWRLRKARAEYWNATRKFLAPSAENLRRKSNLHWLLGQVISLDVVLNQPLDKALLTTACIAADIDLKEANEIERAWAHVSHMEFWLLRLSEKSLSQAQRTQFAREALENANAFIELVGPGAEHLSTTWRQVDRYVSWWGNPQRQRLLGKLGIPRRSHWHDDKGLVPTAKAIARLLAKNGSGEFGGPAQPPEETRSDITAPTRPASGKKLLARPPRSAQQFLQVEMLPAENGDCLLLEYGDRSRRSRVLIDCGARSSVPIVTARLSEAAATSKQPHELFVLTHIDADHISGVLSLFDQPDPKPSFGDIWFNGWHQLSGFLGVRQGEEFSDFLEDPSRKLPWNRAFSQEGGKYPGPAVAGDSTVLPTLTLPGGMKMTLLSPGPKQLKRLARRWHEVLLDLNPAKARMLGGRKPPPPVRDFKKFDLKKLAASPAKQDPSVANGSSIALLAEFGGRSLLLTGDAHADVLEKSIRVLQEARGLAGKPLEIDALKLSHHGSANATTIPLLDVIDCKNYLVSTNGNIFYHPDRESIARVILHGGPRPTLHFNYRSKYNELWDSQVLKRRYKYEARYPDDGAKGLRVAL